MVITKIYLKGKFGDWKAKTQFIQMYLANIKVFLYQFIFTFAKLFRNEIKIFICTYIIVR